MIPHKQGLVAVLVLAYSFSTAALSAENESVVTKDVSPNSTQVIVSGQGLQSLLADSAKTGIDPAKLTATGPDGQIISAFTPGAQITWQRMSVISKSPTGPRPENVANGQGTPGQVQVDTVITTTGKTVTVTSFTWIYEINPSTGQYGWVAAGVTSISYPVNTQQK